MSESASNNESPNLHPVFLRHRRDNTIQAHVLDKLSVVVGDMPDSNDRHAEFGVRSGVTTFDTVERIVCRECGEDAVRVVEGVHAGQWRIENLFLDGSEVVLSNAALSEDDGTRPLAFGELRLYTHDRSSNVALARNEVADWYYERISK